MSAQPDCRPARTYPLPRPDDQDARFSYGLVFDVADVLVRHGYPPPAGPDWAHLLLALHHALYAPVPGNTANS